MIISNAGKEPLPDYRPYEELLQPVRKETTFIKFELYSSMPESPPFFPAQYATDKVKTMDCVKFDTPLPKVSRTPEKSLAQQQATPLVYLSIFGTVRFIKRV